MLSQALRRAGGEIDPEFDNVALLMPFDIDFNDRSKNTFSPSLVGTPSRIAAGVTQWGSVCSLDGSSHLEFANQPEFQFGTGDFTVEVSFTTGSTPGTYTIASHGVSLSDGWVMRILSDGSAEVLYSASSSFGLIAPGIIDWNPSSCYQIRWVRQGGQMNRRYWYNLGSGPFIPPDNWQQSISILPTANTFDFTTSSVLRIGANRTGVQQFVGNIDEFRMTVGVARSLTERQFTPWPQK